MKVSALASIILPLVAASPFQHEKRDGPCNNDNVLRALRLPANTAGSFPFCQSLLGYSPIAYTSTKYLYTTTVTVPVVTSIFSSQHYVTKTSFTNKLYWSQVPNPPPPVSYPTPAPPPTTTAGATPSYVAQYLPSRLSSGCSCLLSPTSTPITTVSATTTATFGRSTSHVSHVDTQEGPWVTYAELCDPSLYIRAYTTAAPARPVRTVTPLPIIDDKADCCQICADTLNCMYWNYGPGGKCKIVYGTDVVSPPDGPDVCPNGIASGGFPSQFAAIDEKNVFSPGPCAFEASGMYQSAQYFQDWCDPVGNPGSVYCNACAFYGGESCN